MTQDHAQLDFLTDAVMDGLGTRVCALEILSKVLGQKKMLESVLESEKIFLSFDTRDRAFVRMMVATVLRRKGQMDDLIARYLEKGQSPHPENLRWILYLGIAQIIFMDVPDHAAVDTAVTLTSKCGLDGKKGFVNALLRRIAREGKPWVDSQDAAQRNIPPWLYQQWIAGYGVARAKQIGLACLTEAPLDITLKDPQTINDWAEKLKANPLSTGSLRRDSGGSVTALPGFDEGAWWVQDAASAIPVKLFGNVAGKTVLDLCAAPGGKTAQLAAAGARVVAVDRSAERMAVLKNNLARLNLLDTVETIIQDGTDYKPRHQFTHILLDAPCSATGTIRRHPDLLHLKTEKDQIGLMGIQDRLLAHAYTLLAPGGMLIYGNCSLQKSEGEIMIDRFLKLHRDMKRMRIRAEEVSGVSEALTPEGDLRFLPSHLSDLGGIDGFYVSRIHKNNY